MHKLEKTKQRFFFKVRSVMWFVNSFLSSKTTSGDRGAFPFNKKCVVTISCKPYSLKKLVVHKKLLILYSVNHFSLLWHRTLNKKMLFFLCSHQLFTASASLECVFANTLTYFFTSSEVWNFRGSELINVGTT